MILQQEILTCVPATNPLSLIYMGNRKKSFQFKPYFLLFFTFLLLVSAGLVSKTVRAQCQPDPFNKNEGLISTGVQISGSFGNKETICISGSDAAYRNFKVPSYQDLENQFFTLNHSSVNKTTNGLGSGTWGFTGSYAGDQIDLETGSITLGSAVTEGVQAAGSGVKVVFIKQDLNINGNVNYAENAPNSGLVLIVGGDININCAVTKINAVLISTGIIRTSVGTCPAGSSYSPQLTINGGLISLNKSDLSTSAIVLGRNLNVNNQPAEVINKQPKYLYILRGILTKDLVITTEDQHYPIVVAGAPSPSPSSTTVAPVICSPVPNPTGVLDTQPVQGCISI